MSLLINKKYEEAHTCRLPKLRDLMSRPIYARGSLYQCDSCSRYWEMDHNGIRIDWVMITAARAKVLLKWEQEAQNG